MGERFEAVTGGEAGEDTREWRYRSRPGRSATSSPDMPVWPRCRTLSPHDLRHRFGYRMAKAVPLHRLAQLMGHDSLDTTRIYVASTRADLQEAVESIAWA